jgi:hypothetical protein
VTRLRFLITAAVIVGALHVPMLPSTLEDIDSVNFALGVRAFDVANHQPHPPGYPVYMALGKVLAPVVRAAMGDTAASAVEARTLAIVSLLAGVGLLWGLFELFSALRATRGDEQPWDTVDVGAAGAALLAVSSPLIFTMTTRPMSDVVGLAFGVAAQACLARAWWWQTPPADGDRRLTMTQIEASGGLIVRGAFLAGLAIGVRTQTLWLTAPLLVLVLADRIGRGAAGALLGALMTSALGSLVWAVPMVVATGGFGEYLSVLGMQAGEDFSSGEMLYTSGSLRALAQGLVYTFVDPWNHPVLGAAVLVLAAVGSLALLRKERRTLVLLSAITLPYLVFHLLFHDTSFIRYAMPLVPVVALLAVRGQQLLLPRAMPAVAGALVVACLAMAVPLSMRAAEAPGVAVQVLSALRAATATERPAALAMHQAFRRPLEAETVPVGPVLPSPPRREWLELVGHWREGGQGPVWFLADPRRSDLALIDPRSMTVRHEYSWVPTEARVFSGVRPNAVQWLEMRQPRWMAETGWALTPETAGMAELMHAGPHVAPIVAQVRRGPDALRLLIGGRHLGAAGDPDVQFTVSIDDAEVAAFTVSPGFFLRTVMLPAGVVAPGGPESGRDGPYAPLQVVSVPVTGAQPVVTAIEQFDLQTPETLMWGYAEGWHEAEYRQTLGVWRWTSAQASLRVVGASTPVRVAVRYEAPRLSFTSPSTVRLLVDGRVMAEQQAFDTNGVLEATIPLEALNAADGVVRVETSQTFTPAERSGATDRRALGLRVFGVTVDAQGLR